MKLEDYIKGLEEMTKPDFFKAEVQKAFNAVIRKMIEYQIYDSNQSRAIFRDIARKDLGYDNSDLLLTAINFWKKEYRAEGLGDYSSEFKTLNNYYNLVFEIKEESVYQQEMGNVHYPSNNPELSSLRDNSKFRLYHLTLACDEATSGRIKEFEDALNDILYKLESRL